MAAGGGFRCDGAVFAQVADHGQRSAKLACRLASRIEKVVHGVEHTENRPFIQRFNASYDGFPYGFCVFRMVLARFSDWFGGLGRVRGWFSAGSGLSNAGPPGVVSLIPAPWTVSSTFSERGSARSLQGGFFADFHHLPPSGRRIRLSR